MEKQNLIIIHVVAIILIFIIGGGVGILVQQQGLIPSKTTTKVQAVQTLSSKVVPSITAFGKVTKIDGKNITVTSGIDTLVIKMTDSAQVYLPATSTSPQQTVQFSDIKVGDNASVNLKLLPDGQIEGQMVVIFQSK